MPLINQKWPLTLLPATCDFGRDRNDFEMISPRNLSPKNIIQQRPLWTCSLTWRLPLSSLAEFRYWMDGLEGQQGSVQLWDFGQPIRTEWESSGINVRVAAAVGATTVAIRGFPLVAGQQLRRGERIQFGRRLYLIDQTTNINAANGLANAIISTPLLTAVAPNDVVTIPRASCEMQLVRGSWSASGSAGDGFLTASAEFIETVSDYT